MKKCRRLALAVMLGLLFNAALVLPVSAAKPQKSNCGMLLITTSGEDANIYMAVCVEEEDGRFVYSGNHPIEQQVGIYASVTNSLEGNNAYEIEEDTDYTAVPGIYRFALKEKVQSGSAADVFPEMAAAKKNETVYFVHLNLDENDVFVMEKTTVASVRDGVLTTKDKLEESGDNGEFGVIFNENSEVVGFCKSGIAYAPASGNSGGFAFVYVGAAVLLAAGLVAWLIQKKQKKEAAPVHDSGDTQWDDNTTLESATQIDEYVAAPVELLVLKCHGGYLSGRLYPIPPEGITIGREPDNSIRYPGQTPGISRHHARLFWQNGQLMLLDVGSSNGTYLNQSGRIAPMHPVPLHPGDVFYLGEKRNAFEICRK